MDKTALRLLAARSLPAYEDDLPSASVQFAEVTSDGAGEENLYEYTDKLEASEDWGGIQQTWGDPAMGDEHLTPGSDPKPNAVTPNVSAALRMLSSRLGYTDDPLTKDQENYGTGSTLSKASSLSSAQKKALDRLLVVKDKIKEIPFSTFVQQVSGWFTGAVGNAASAGKGWGSVKAPNIPSYVTGMSQIGRMYQTSIPKVAYRVCRKNTDKATPVGFKGTLNVGPRPMVSFTRTAKAAQSFGKGFRSFGRIVVRVAVDAKNYVATQEACAGFASDLDLLKTQDEALAQLDANGLKTLKKFAGLLLRGINAYRVEDEIMLIFKNNQSVPCEVVSASHEGGNFNGYLTKFASVADTDNDFELDADTEFDRDLQSIDPILNSSYGRESSANGNTTQNKLLSVAVQDGDFDAHGYAGADRLVTDDPATNGYLNVHSAIQLLAAKRKRKGDKHKSHSKKHSKAKSGKRKFPEDLEDADWEYLTKTEAEVEVEADADPMLFNVAEQPMGQCG